MSERTLGRSCWEKVKRTEVGAKAVVEHRRLGKKGGINPRHENLQAYKCEFCDGWHVGHSLAPNPITKELT